MQCGNWRNRTTVQMTGVIPAILIQRKYIDPQVMLGWKQYRRYKETRSEILLGLLLWACSTRTSPAL